MSTLPHDSDSDEIFGHLLDYQQTDEFKTEDEAQHESRLEHVRPINREAQRRYHLKYPHAARMRADAQRLKAQLAERQSDLCYWCHALLPLDYQTDHIIPISRGGTNATVNLCVCCPRCNQTKAAKIVRPEQGKLF